MTDLQTALFLLQDPDYRAFHARLMPTIPFERIIGIRTPVLRRFAKTLDAAQRTTFLSALPHDYYEENNLHAFLIEPVRDFDEALALTEHFLPFIDNWATCDSFHPRAFDRAPERLLPAIDRWLSSGETYTIRFAIDQLMRHFLDVHFSPDIPARLAALDSDEYYVNMAIAWYFATALAKQEKAILPYFTQRCLLPAVHRRAVQKVLESYRISPDLKCQLRILR